VQSSAGGALIGINGAGIRIGSKRCKSSLCTTTHACALEAMRTQASPDLCAEFSYLHDRLMKKIILIFDNAISFDHGKAFEIAQLSAKTYIVALQRKDRRAAALVLSIEKPPVNAGG
jgi:hypothetical protein